LTIDYIGFEECISVIRSYPDRGPEQKFKGGLADNAEETVALHTGYSSFA
jgi:hypothetical protein